MSLPAPSRPSTPTSTSSASTVERAGKISCEPIPDVIKSREPFNKLYVSVTNRAIAMYGKGGRRNFPFKLHGCVAALDLLRARNKEPILMSDTVHADERDEFALSHAVTM
ncbi:hypothetical protein AURDEDRAFT_175698 [Auricularia subglabra TFB-10046 SS5]|nr:hypothetical protein AURDEDRAFT_175698 [Auricularia subglabra TFB-10046 SS5]